MTAEEYNILIKLKLLGNYTYDEILNLIDKNKLTQEEKELIRLQELRREGITLNKQSDINKLGGRVINMEFPNWTIYKIILPNTTLIDIVIDMNRSYREKFAQSFDDKVKLFHDSRFVLSGNTDDGIEYILSNKKIKIPYYLLSNISRKFNLHIPKFIIENSEDNNETFEKELNKYIIGDSNYDKRSF